MVEDVSWNIASSTENDAEFIDDKIVEFNKTQVPFTQSQSFTPLNFHIKDAEGQIIAGINALSYCWKMLYIDVLFVAEEYRGKKLGSLLLNKVESEARLMGIRLVHLDSFDFQAKDFYIKHGYEIFGVLEDCPENHKRYYLKKRL